MTNEELAELERLLDDYDTARAFRLERDALASLIATAREAEALREVLADPQAVHLNMLRGGIAKPSPVNIWHIYGKELLDAMPDEYRGDTEALRAENAKLRDFVEDAAGYTGEGPFTTPWRISLPVITTWALPIKTSRTETTIATGIAS